MSVPGRLPGTDTRMKASANGWHYGGYEAVEPRNGVPEPSYRWRPRDQDPGTVERVCRWRRSLIAAALVLELAAEQAGEQR